MNQKEKTECMGFDGMQKMNGAMFVGPEAINVKRIIKRMRGTRRWHPLLQELREVELG